MVSFFWCHEQVNRKRVFFLVLQISPLLFQNSCMRNTTSKIGLPSRHNTILRCPKTRLSMREIQFFSDVKWEIDKESFSGLETALQWVSFSTQWVEIISGIASKWAWLSGLHLGLPSGSLGFESDRRTETLRSLSWFGYSSGLLSFKKPETVLWTIAKHYYYYYYYYQYLLWNCWTVKFQVRLLKTIFTFS